MTHTDKEDLKLIMSSAVSEFAATTNGKFDVIKVELEAIKQQTTKTNGRVSKIEEKIEDNEDEFNHKITEIEARLEQLKINDIEHVINCPNLSKIKSLESQISATRAIKKYIYTSIILLGAIAGIAITFFQIYQSYHK